MDKDLSEFQLARLKKLQYTLMAGKGRGEVTYPELHNKVFRFWKDFWTHVYGKQGSLDAFNLDDFSRQDVVGVLHSGDEVVALNLSTVFQADLQACREHHYFKFYPPEVFEFLKSEGARTLATIEFFSVNPNWRSHLAGLSLGEIVVGLGVNLSRALGADAMFAAARTEVGSSRMGQTYGMRCFQAGLVKRNFKIDLLVGFLREMHPHPDPQIQGWVDQYWSQRTDLTGITTGGKKPERKVA